MLLMWCTLAKRRKTLESQMQTSIANMCWRIIQKLIQLFQVCKMSPPHKYARHLSSMCHGQLWSFSLAIGTLSWTRCTLREIYVILSENFIWATSKKFYVECIFPLKSFTLLKMLQSEKQSNLCFTPLFVKRPLCSLSKQLFLFDWKHAPVFAIHSETARLWNGQKSQNEIYIFFIRILMHFLMDFVLLYCQGSIHSSEREQKIISGDLFSCLMVSCAISWSFVPSLS